jgi:hypothetical protein
MEGEGERGAPRKRRQLGHVVQLVFGGRARSPSDEGGDDASLPDISEREGIVSEETDMS